ncbi:restriction endonuclease [Streptomyces sp. M41]|uniref:restriction endonuclease n=1 Tax=Streptomyces sp. M41 TaxID=3059412 RepID=UPI00374DE58F
MTAPADPTPPANRRQRFNLRSTALFFVLLAVALSVLGLAARTVADAVEQRPAWMFALVAVGIAGSTGLGRRWHLAGAARRAAAALDEAARRAADELEAPVIPRQRPVAAAEVTVAYDAPGPGVCAYDALTPEEFEEAIAALCERDGCSAVEVVGGAGDLGADVLAVSPEGSRVVIQCKRYDPAHRVGSQDLQRFGGTCFTVHGADMAVLVTTSDFTTPALEYAEQCGIVCVDGETLRAWTDGTGPRPWEAAAQA